MIWRKMDKWRSGSALLDRSNALAKARLSIVLMYDPHNRVKVKEKLGWA
jgi:hypothetical protein